MRAKTIKNEQVKLSATYANGLALAIFVVGALTPIVNQLEADKSIGNPVVIVVVCIVVSGALHLLARQLLRGLQP